MDLTEFFGEPISIYTDAHALEDGVLVDVSMLGVSFKGLPIKRMTQHLWSDFGTYFEIDGRMNHDGLANALRTKCGRATYSGGIWILPPNIWLVENDVNGWTLMFPEDY
jgi:hypothetical protein